MRLPGCWPGFHRYMSRFNRDCYYANVIPGKRRWFASSVLVGVGLVPHLFPVSVSPVCPTRSALKTKDWLAC